MNLSYSSFRFLLCISLLFSCLTAASVKPKDGWGVLDASMVVAKGPVLKFNDGKFSFEATPFLSIKMSHDLVFYLRVKSHNGICNESHFNETYPEVLIVEGKSVKFTVACDDLYSAVYRPTTKFGNEYMINKFESLYYVDIQNLYYGVKGEFNGIGFTKAKNTMEAWLLVYNAAL